MSMNEIVVFEFVVTSDWWTQVYRDIPILSVKLRCGDGRKKLWAGLTCY